MDVGEPGDGHVYCSSDCFQLQCNLKKLEHTGWSLSDGSDVIFRAWVVFDPYYFYEGLHKTGNQ